MTSHVLKVVPPYFEALADGSKTFEVRRNDRAFQRGDVLYLREWDTSKCSRGGCSDVQCPAWGATIAREVSYVLSGDPRFGGIEAGFVVLALAAVGAK